MLGLFNVYAPFKFLCNLYFIDKICIIIEYRILHVSYKEKQNKK
jgi:hypothetical protein